MTKIFFLLKFKFLLYLLVEDIFLGDLIWIILILAIVIAVFIYSLYVSVIKSKNNLKEALSDVDVQLKKRLDLIPNLLKAAAKYMEHEKTIFDQVVKAR